jgi:uroporphyrin-3 C-methyltransferase
MEEKKDKISDDDAVEGRIIEVEPEVEEEQKSNADNGNENHHDNAETTSRGSRSVVPLILAIVALIAITASWIAGYRYWQNLKADLTVMQERINSTLSQQQQLSKDIENASSELQQQKQSIEKQAARTAQQDEKIRQESEQLSRQTEIMQLAVDQVSQKIGRTNNQWQLAEAESLMRIANQRLSLNRDINTAISALQQADQKLLQSGNLGLTDIRNALAGEINQLKSVNLPDITGMAATLQSLSQQVSQLKPAGATLTRSTADTASDGQQAERSLDTLLEDTWKGFQQLVVVRKHNQPISAMLPPSQQYFLYQNLQLQLETARLALLRKETVIFHSSLDTAMEWIKSFFELKEATASNMLNNLQSLKTAELSPTMPDITASLEQLVQYREAKE